VASPRLADYAYIICRLDIGYAVTFLSCFAAAPDMQHYAALKNVCRYLCAAKAWVLVYRRSSPVAELPDDPFDHPSLDDSLPPFPQHNPLELLGYVDAAHARSQNPPLCLRLGFLPRRRCRGAAVAYKSKLQATGYCRDILLEPLLPH
jgi:hypothetical protein